MGYGAAFDRLQALQAGNDPDQRHAEGVSGSGDDPLDDDDTAPLTMPGEAGYGAPADGTFDEIAIYERVLTQDEVRSHFCAIVDDVAICP